MKIRLLIAVLLICLDTHAQSWEIGARSGFTTIFNNWYLTTNKYQTSAIGLDNQLFFRYSETRRWVYELNLSLCNTHSNSADTSHRIFASYANKYHVKNSFTQTSFAIQYQLSNINNKTTRQYIGVSLTYLFQSTSLNYESTELDNNTTSKGDNLINNTDDINTCFLTGINYYITRHLTNRLTINALVDIKVNLHFWGGGVEPMDQYPLYSFPSVLSGVKLGLSYTL